MVQLLFHIQELGLQNLNHLLRGMLELLVLTPRNKYLTTRYTSETSLLCLQSLLTDCSSVDIRLSTVWGGTAGICIL